MKNILKIFKRKFLFWWVVLFLLVALKAVSNTNNVVALKLETSLSGGIGYVIGYCFSIMFFITFLATPLYALVGLISKKWEAQTMMIIITALTLFGCLGYLWF
ncbi:hypothetical protein N9V81_00430 [Flavobacteriaceae bacterium]|nr:hypothetical protein [Flavobacteriaceae bacterium]